MKKPSLEMLRLTAGEVLQRSEMKKISGGYGGSRFYCVCSGSVGAWSGTYASLGDAYAAGTINCASAVAECRPI